MKDMSTQPVVNIRTAPTSRARAQRRMRSLAAAARTAAAAAADPSPARPAFDQPVRGGRAWLNGQEIGGYDGRYEHLTRAYE